MVSWASSQDRNCDPLPFSLTITEPPAHGTTSVITGIGTQRGVLKLGSDPTGCLTRPREAQEVMYQSDAGFQGTDTLTYRVQTRNGSWTTTVTINVQ
jgi:hypothetical protein